MRIAGAIAALLAVAALAGAARAELFRCKGPDGKMIYTDQKHTCPGADPSEPTGVVHHAETPEPSRRGADVAPAAHAPGAAATDPGAGAEEFWRQKKRDAEQQLAQIRAQRERFDISAGHCKRPGAYVVTRDDAGIQKVANCSELLREFHALEAKEAAARDYLASGLSDECRRAGCLPGWVR
ncbi:MAG TPA: DUF4124 domain-containing protein [Myxococcota bacterium]|nr:DUF4124 domain-containing protein [Myxococcota bacterium]